jgi:predicted DNA-binding ribbon-helix-helix protein
MTLLTVGGNNHRDCWRRRMSRQISPVRGRSLPDPRVRFKPSCLENCRIRGDRRAMQQGTIVKRSVRIAGHATSISLEEAFWQALCDVAAARRMSVNVLIATIDATRSGNLSSAIRLFVLDAACRGQLTGNAARVTLAASA